ncbi:MAG: winged helix-turn-helix transcriptional regulator [Rickettsiales bacterium]|nr:winged helix-turn-helix transcriptional regulator [Rickettsiales bacterium]
MIDAIRANPTISRKELADIVGLSSDGIKWNLDKLKKDGKVRRIGPDRGGHWKVL